ncbi:N(4)-(beta-N-acetylglucosaminyl)-L-asparaginase [Bacteroidota bacterium]
MKSRRNFIKTTALSSIGLLSACKRQKKDAESIENEKMEKVIPVVVSTWKHGLAANEAAWKVLSDGGRALDAVEQGVRVSESDPEVTSVGYGGYPDRDGNVTLDACIMDETANCGSVAFIENIKNPVSVARLVMEKTPHVMLAGEGAQKFALDNGFKMENLLTETAKKDWERWIETGVYKPWDYDANHDTIGMVALDKNGDISGACTTSGLKWKMHGRVGDSPIIGAALFVDNDIGGAAATGVGEAVMKTLGSFLIVEQMRNGKSPQEACETAIHRIAEKLPDFKEIQVGFVAVNKYGETGAYSIQRGFEYALYKENKNELIKAKYLIYKG